MRRMYTEKQVRELADEEVAGKVVESLAGKDISIGSATISGNLSVSGAINGEENPSVKPIYCHPIVLQLDDDNAFVYAECLIFNNTETPFTWASFKTYLQSFVGTIMLTGGCKDKANNKVVITTMLRNTGTSIFIYGVSVNGEQALLTNIDLASKTITLQDNVNKIN